jgi:hypothetical protein
MQLILLPLGLLAVYLATRDGLLAPRGGASTAADTTLPAVPTPLPPGVHLVSESAGAPLSPGNARMVSPHTLSVAYCVS